MNLTAIAILGAGAYLYFRNKSTAPANSSMSDTDVTTLTTRILASVGDSPNNISDTAAYMIYAAANYYKIPNEQLDRANGWNPGTALAWEQAQGLPLPNA